MPLHRTSVNLLMDKYGAEAGVSSTKLSPHVLKHTAGMMMRASGAKLEVIQAWLGHKKLDSTAQYLRCTQDEVEVAANLAFAAVAR